MDAEARLNLVPQRTLVDGVPVFWSSHASQPTIALIFRVGQVDEPFAHLGISHAVEHLALNARRGAPYPFNGQVSSTTTVFTASGSPSELALFARALCNSLRHLQVDQLRRELSVLATEAETTTVLFSACAALLKNSNGRRLLLGEDLQQLEIVPEDWRDGGDLVGLLDAAVPDDRIVWTA